MENNQNAGERLRADAAELMNTAKIVTHEQLETGKQIAARQGEKVAAVIDRAASRLETRLHSLADYTGDLGKRIRKLSEDLQKGRRFDDLVTDVRDIARRNPKTFLLGGLAVGIGVYKILKASAERRHESNSREFNAADKPSNDA